MGRKRETLLRWVNCCYESASSFERLSDLSNGVFFLHILNIDANSPHIDSCPWTLIASVLDGNKYYCSNQSSQLVRYLLGFNLAISESLCAFTEQNIAKDVVNFRAASSGDEDEIAKLVAVCMHLTMVLSPRDDIKHRTMTCLSNEEQSVIKNMLHAIVNDSDHMSRNQLADIVHDPPSGKCRPWALRQIDISLMYLMIFNFLIFKIRVSRNTAPFTPHHQSLQ